MPGLRLRHATERSSTLTLVDGSRPYQAPVICLAKLLVDGGLRPCGRTHLFKTYHLLLDDQGATIVSVEIWQRLRAMPGSGGFTVESEVLEPPDQVVRAHFVSRSARAIAPGRLS